MPIYVRGAFNEWEATNELEYVGNYTYFDRVVVDTPTNIYKFADEDWSFFNFGAPVAENGITLAASPPNLEIHFDKLGIYKSHFFTIPRAGNEDYYFHRFEYDPGPVGADIYLAVNDGADAQLIDYLGDSQYQIDAHLSAGENRIRFIDDAGASLLGARFSSEQWEQGSTLSLVESGMEIVVNVSTTALYRFNIAAVSGNYVLDIEPLVDHGPYGPLYLRGGVALTGQEDWLVADENLFVYEHDYQQLILRKSVDTRYTLASDWAFKVASQDWANQFAGSGEWLSNDNKVDIGQVFDLAQLIDGEGIEPEPLWVEPQLSSGMTIEFIIDVSEQSAPTLRVLLK